MTRTWDIVIRLRPTIVVAALAFAILALPSQIFDLYLIDIETVDAEVRKFYDHDPGKPPDTSVFQFLANTYAIWCAMLAGVLAMVVLWLSSAHLVCLAPDRKEWRWGRRWLAAALVVLIALAPVLGVLTGLGNVLANLEQIVPRRDDISDGAAILRESLRTYVAISGGLALAAALLFGFLTFSRLDAVSRLGNRVFSTRGVAIGLALILGFTATIIIWPTVAPWAIGTQALIYLFLAALAFVLTWFSQIYRRTGWPVTVMVAAASFVFAAFGWNDNHWVEHKVAAESRTLEKGFEQWLLERADRKGFADKGKPYPVYIVATEGGGMYAGYHAASWLGEVQDSCARFAQHVFAISSVSGGSLGAGVFAALANRYARNSEYGACVPARAPTFSWTARDFFDKDLLAPLVGATLFPDFLQRLLPVPFKQLDRGRALEEAFSVAWDQSNRKDTEGDFKRPLSTLWNPKGAAPALFLNTTSVNAGSRVSIGTLRFQQTPTALHVNSTLCLDTQKSVDMPLATAVSLSARFPWLTPAGWLDLKDSGCRDKSERDRVYLVDGGYFENSGLETAIDIATYMRMMLSDGDHARKRGIDRERIRAEYPHGVEIKIIMIFALDGAASRYIRSEAERTGLRPGELLPPLQTLLAGRAARTRAVHLRAVEEGFLPFTADGMTSPEYAIDPEGDVRVGRDAVHQVWLDGKKFFLPLGWRLSRRSQQTIGSQQGVSSSLATRLVLRELEGKDTTDLKQPKGQ
jgi:MFS family permease